MERSHAFKTKEPEKWVLTACVKLIFNLSANKFDHL
jgi:hypothetical protein